MTEDLPGGVLLSAWSAGEDLLAVGGKLDGSDGLVVWESEGSWCADPVPAATRPIWWLHGADSDSWFAVGDGGLVLRGQQAAVVDESLPTSSTLYGVWDDGESVWAVGGDVFGTGAGEIWSRREGVWELYEAELPGVIFKVWDGWFVGDGVVYRMEDDQLVDLTPEPHPRLLTVRGRAPDDVWAVGGRTEAELWHWDGLQWARVEVDPRCAVLPLTGVWTAPGEDVWIAGMQGAMGRWDGESWECPDLALTWDDLHAVWKHGEDVFWFGGNLSSQSSNHGTIVRYGSRRGGGPGGCG